MSLKVALDSIDRRILVELQKDARLPNKALATRLGIAESTCHQRVRSLRERKVITGFHATIDLAAVGRPIQALISIRFRPHSRELVEPFWTYVLDLPETLRLSHLAGPDDFLLHVAVRDVQQLRDFILDRLTTRPEVGHVQTTVVFEQRQAAGLIEFERSDGSR
jgi:DNA-binding Lrp family transcriptional regulator